MLTDATMLIIFYAVVGLVALIAIALVLRPVFLWLLGIQEITRLLERQNQLLEKLTGEAENASAVSPVPPSASQPR